MNSNSTFALTNQYRCTDARTGMSKIQSVTVPVLILELNCLDDESKAIKYFQCELSKNKKNHSVPRKGDFAKLYRITLGADPGQRFSKSQQLIKHLIGRFFNCETKLATDKKTGEPYQKVTDIRPVEIQKSDAWTGDGSKINKPKNRQKALTYSAQLTGTELAPICQNPLVTVLATNWQQTGNNLATTWQPTGNDESPQPAKTLGLQPFSIPLNHPYQDNKTINTQGVIDEKINTDTPHKSESKIIAIRKPVAGESGDDFLDRFLTESLSNTHHPKTITCKGCSHFESYHKHGGGSGSCLAGVMPYGACWWADTRHECDKFQTNGDNHGRK